MLMMIAIHKISGLAASVKVAWVAVGSLTLSAGGWVSVLAAETSNDSNVVESLIPASALSAVSAALVWVVRQIVSGQLVHRDPAQASEALADAVRASVEVGEKSLERERILTELLLASK